MGSVVSHEGRWESDGGGGGSDTGGGGGGGGVQSAEDVHLEEVTWRRDPERGADGGNKCADERVRVSEAVRLRVERKSTSVLEPKPIALDQDALIESEMEVCKRLGAMDHMWLQRLRSLRGRFSFRRGICPDNVERIMDKIEDLVIPLDANDPCANIASKVTECYKRHSRNTLRCSEIVHTYVNKVHEESRIRVRKLGRVSAISELSALECEKIRNMDI